MKEPSKATIADAKVAAVNTCTNFRYERATNGAGEYTLANLPPGTYRIENGRSFQTLIMLTPGVVVTQTAFDDQGQFSVNGQRADANYFTVDGVSANFGVTGLRLSSAVMQEWRRGWDFNIFGKT